MVFYWQTIAMYIFGINSHVLQHDSSSVPRQCGAWRMAPCAWPRMHTHGHTHIFPLKCCVLLFSSTTWSKHHCDQAVQTLEPEPVSPKSVIQVNSVVEMHSIVILPWAMNTPSDIAAQKGFLKKPRTLLIFFFLISKILSTSSSMLWPS